MYYSYLHHDKKYSVLTLLAAFLSVPVVFGEFCASVWIVDATLPPKLCLFRDYCLACEFAVASYVFSMGSVLIFQTVM